MDIHEDKDILIGRMLDPDSILTERELDLIMQDEELREILDVSAAVRSASKQPSSIDVEKEWRLFRHRLHPKLSRWRWAMRVAAIFLGVLFVSAVVKVGIDLFMTDDAPTVVAESKPVSSPLPTEIMMDSKPLLVVEDDAIPNPENASSFRRKIPKPSNQVLTEDEEIDVDEYLRIDQARIDNEMAVAMAELYIDRYEALHDADMSLAEEDGYGNNEIRYVIMQ